MSSGAKWGPTASALGAVAEGMKLDVTDSKNVDEVVKARPLAETSWFYHGFIMFLCILSPSSPPCHAVRHPIKAGFMARLLGRQAVTEKYGAPDILVNNAGITKDTLMMRCLDRSEC